jgi:bifunctional ADP-heptose synthase (sugar kinase/adenylyltransferase)
MLTDYEKGLLDGWDTMQNLIKQPLSILKTIAPKSANSGSYPSLFSSINYGEAEEMLSKLQPETGDEIRISIPNSNKFRIGYIAYTLNNNYIKLFTPDTLEFVTWTFPNTDLVKTGRNKRELIEQMWEIIEQLDKEETN